MDLKLQKRYPDCGWLNNVRVQWATHGGVAEWPRQNCGRRLTSSVYGGIYEDRLPQLRA